MNNVQGKYGNIRKLRKEAGLSRQEVFERFNIPVKSLINWESGNSRCPEYVLDYICEKLNQEIRNRRAARVLIKIEENRANPDEAPSQGLAFYADSKTLSWFYPFHDGCVSTDALTQLMLLKRSGCEIEFEYTEND